MGGVWVCVEQDKGQLCAFKGFHSVTFSRDERLGVLLPSLCT